MKKFIKITTWIILSILILWTILTFIVESKGAEKMEVLGYENGSYKAVILYDPDPFYNFDEQVCLGMAKGLAENGWQVKVVSVAAAKEITKDTFDLYGFCANTYNWAPDWTVAKYINGHSALQNAKVVAITLGSGSTDRAQRVLEAKIKAKAAVLLDSKTYWLMRPNDELRLEESNVAVAVDMAYRLGAAVAQRLELKAD